MKWLIAIFLVCSLNIVCKADIDTTTVAGKKVAEKMRILRSEKVTVMVCYYLKCSVDEKPLIADSCAGDDVTYLIWSDKGKSFIERFAGCKTYIAAPMSPVFLELIKKNYKVILKEKIWPPQFTHVEFNGRKLVYNEVAIGSCHTIFEMHLGNTNEVAGFNNFEMDTKYDNNKYLNRNYYRNQKTILCRLKKIVERKVATLN